MPTVNPERAAARARREQVRRRRTIIFSLSALLLVVGSVIITALLGGFRDKDVTKPDTGTGASPILAALPYAETNGDLSSAPQLGPVRQTENYTMLSAPDTAAPLPARGMVSNRYFADAAFLGDSLTEGFSENFVTNSVDMGGALICGYVGCSANSIVNRTVLNHPTRGSEVPLEVLAANQPAKLYLLIGTNALSYSVDNDTSFLEYYGAMLDALRETLPNTLIYVQGLTPTRPEVAEKSPGLANDRLRSINENIRVLAAQRGMKYLNTMEWACDENGNLQEGYDGGDGIHLSTAGYKAWVQYLRSHTVYHKDNPYTPGSTFYIA